MLLGTAAALVLLAAPRFAHAADVAEARKLLARGKYAEALEAFGQGAARTEPASALGIARCLRATGKLEPAKEALRAALKDHPDAAALRAELALIAVEQGDYALARQEADAALKQDGNQLPARWALAELDRLSGKLEEANRSYRWFVDYYNANEISDAETLGWIGLPAAQYARWNRLSDQFSFLVNELYKDALALDVTYWQAPYEQGRLFLEKYNQPDALKAFRAALAINPNSAEAHSALAGLALQNFDLAEATRSIDRALAINPVLLSARQLQADVLMANVEPLKASELLRIALPLNPTSHETLGRLAACYAALDGRAADPLGPRAGKIAREVNAGNAHAGHFYMAMADGFDRMRRFPLAAQYYREAAARMPQLDTAQGQLGLMLMRLADEPAAHKVLKDSFEADPFNVRVKNTLEVLDLLATYRTLETEHFILRYDPKTDARLAAYAARYLEKVYPELCAAFAYEPQGKTLIEIFNDARGASGHNWFSTRVVGLPQIHTVGACAGRIVALQSPAGPQKFSWARLLKHEFVHVINLQQTNFNIPHWLTEGLAVESEGNARPSAWTRLLTQRLRAGKIYDVDSINLGFIRPKSSDDWTLAYCQAELYVEHITARFGRAAISRLLACYAENLTTHEALRKALAVEPADLEKTYRSFLESVVADKNAAPLKPGADSAASPKTKPSDADELADKAVKELKRRHFDAAGRLADEALALDAKHRRAVLVRARLHLRAGESDKATALLTKALDEQHPDGELLTALASLRVKDGNLAEAARLYELGAKHLAGDSRWAKALAVAYMKLGDDARLAGVLEQLALDDADDLVVRKKLATLKAKQKDVIAAGRWAREAIEIDVDNAAMHRLVAAALVEQGQHRDATVEYETILEIEPADQPSREALAACYKALGENEKAKAVLAAGKPIAVAADSKKPADPKTTAEPSP